MPKTGHPLAEIVELPERVTSTLRQHLSVTTVEEFLDLASRYPAEIQRLLEVDASQWTRLLELAQSTVSKAELDEALRPQATDYPFMTGHDAPDASNAGGTRKKGSGRD